MKQLLTYLLLVASLALHGQVDTANATTAIDTIRMLDGVSVDNVEVIKQFEATLIDAQPTALHPTAPTTPARTATYSYDITIIPIDLDYPDPIIKPYAMRPDPPRAAYQLWARAGYGSISNPTADLGYVYQADRWSLNTMVSYDALDNTRTIDRQQMSDIQLRALGDIMHGEHHRIHLGLRGRVADYGLYSDRGTAPDTDTSIGLNGGGLTIGYQTVAPLDGGWRYDVTLDGDVLDHSYHNLTEATATLGTGISKQWTDHLLIGLKADVLTNDVRGDLRSLSYTAWYTAPSASLRYDTWWLDVGAAIYGDGQTTIWPQVELGAELAQGRVIPYLGSRLTYELNNVGQVTQVNPYILPTDIGATTLRSIYGGIRGNLGLLRYEGEVLYHQAQDYLFFEPIDQGGGAFIFFDPTEQDVDLLEIAGSVDADVAETISIGAHIRQRIFDLQEGQAWGIPLFELGGHAEVKLLAERLTIMPELAIASIAPFDLDDNDANGLIDLSVGLKYKIGDQVGVWADANNLLDNEYRRWAGYPTVGIHAQGGLWIKF